MQNVFKVKTENTIVYDCNIWLEMNFFVLLQADYIQLKRPPCIHSRILANPVRCVRG